MHHPIRIGSVSVLFHKSRHETQGGMDVFEMTFPPQANLIIPHLHRDYDETILGVDGITTWTVDGVTTQLHPGQQLVISRGQQHVYGNRHPLPARILCIITPGLLGPEYFRELATIYNAEGPPNIAEIGTVMTRYGVIPASV